MRKVTVNLQNMRESGDAEGVSAILEVCLRSNFAGIENPRLYSETYYGTKDRICEYIAEGKELAYVLPSTEVLTMLCSRKIGRVYTTHRPSVARGEIPLVQIYHEESRQYCSMS